MTGRRKQVLFPHGGTKLSMVILSGQSKYVGWYAQHNQRSHTNQHHMALVSIRARNDCMHVYLPVQDQVRELYESRVSEMRGGSKREDFSDLVAAKAAQQKRKIAQKAEAKASKKAKGDSFKF